MADERSEESYVLLFKAGKPPASERLSDPTSTASMIARARGEGMIAKMTPERRVEPLKEDEALGGNEEIVMKFEEGTIAPETGYVMQFINRQFVSSPLSVLDIATIPEMKAYPVPETAIESLPEIVINKADTQGYVRFTGDYSIVDQVFENITLGWDTGSVNPLEKLIRIAEKTGSAVKSLDYVLFLYGPPEWQDEEAIAEFRGIQPDTVRQNIIDVAEQLGDGEEPDPFKQEGADGKQSN
jgi:hypothetical protein